MLTGRIFDAPEAERIGLVTEVVPDDALLEAAYAKADQIMLNTPFGVMEGTYQMVTSGGDEFEARVAPFTLSEPYTVH